MQISLNRPSPTFQPFDLVIRVETMDDYWLFRNAIWESRRNCASSPEDFAMLSNILNAIPLP